MRFADLTQGDVVEHPRTGFRWTVFYVEPVTRTFRWAPLPSSIELTRMPIKPRWSPPHSLDDWELERDATVSRR